MERRIIGKGAITSTGGKVLQGNIGISIDGATNPASVGHKASCPRCNKGQGSIVAVGRRTIMLPAGPVAFEGDYIACGCPALTHTTIAAQSSIIGGTAAVTKSTLPVFTADGAMNGNLQVTFNDAQLQQLLHLFHNNEPAEAYKYLLSQIKQRDEVDGDTKYWFEQAIGINLDQDTPANTFIKAFTTKGLAMDGIVATDELLQQISDNIANNVIIDILRKGGLPKFDQLVSADIRIALDQGGQTIGGWGGAFYFWQLPFGQNKQTVGQLIETDPLELNKFRQCLEYATQATWEKHGFAAVDDIGKTLLNDDTWYAGWRYLFNQ